MTDSQINEIQRFANSDSADLVRRPDRGTHLPACTCPWEQFPASLNGVGTRSLRTYPESTRYKTTGTKPPFPLAGLAPANLQLFDIQLIPTMLVLNLLTLTSEILDGYSFHSNGAVPYNPQKNNGCFRCARPKDRNNMLAKEKTDYTHRTNSLHDR